MNNSVRHANNQHKDVGALRSTFRSCAHWSALTMGSPWAFLFAAFVILVLAVLGPAFHYSDTCQLSINTATTLVTFLIDFLILNTHNRVTQAMQLILDELLRGLEGA